MINYVLESLIIPTYLGIVMSNGLEDKKGKELIKKFEEDISTFNKQFEKTELDTGCFESYLKEIGEEKIYKYIFEYSEIYSGDIDIIEELSKECIEYMNNIKSKNGWSKIKNHDDFYNYFRNLINLLKQKRSNLMSIEEKSQVNIIIENSQKEFSKINHKLDKLVTTSDGKINEFFENIEDIKKLYIDKIYKWCELIEIDTWDIWTSTLLSGDQPVISVDMMEKLEKTKNWISCTLWPEKYKDLEEAFVNFERVLDDLIKEFYKYSDRVGKIYKTTRFYQIREWNQERYNELLNEYNFHTALIRDLVSELTRAANYICDNIRRYIISDFRLEEGLLFIICGSFAFSNKVACYKKEEYTLQPYPGLNEFMIIRDSRDFNFGSGNLSWD